MVQWRALVPLLVFVGALLAVPAPTFAAGSTVPMTATLSNGAVGATNVTDDYTVTWNSSNGCQWVVNAVTITAPPGQSFANVSQLTWINGSGTSNGTYSPTAVSTSSVSFSLGSGACEGGNYTNEFEISGVTNTATPASGTSTLDTFDNTTPETTSTVTLGTYNGLSLTGPSTPQDPFGASLSAQVLANGSPISAPNVTVTFAASGTSTPAATFVVNGNSSPAVTAVTNSNGVAPASIMDSVSPDTVTVTASIPASTGTYTATATYSLVAESGTIQATTATPLLVEPADAGTVSVPLGSVTWTDNWDSGYIYADAQPASAVIDGTTATLPWSETATLSSTCSLNQDVTSASISTSPATAFYDLGYGPLYAEPSFVTPPGGCTESFVATFTVDWNVEAGTYPLVISSPSLTPYFIP